MWTVTNCCWCMSLKTGVHILGVLSTLAALETLFVFEMDCMTMMLWILMDISVHVAWVMILWKDSENAKYRKGMFVTMKMAFMIGVAISIGVLFMLMEIVKFLMKARKVTELNDNEYYAMLPGLMRFEEEEAAEDMEDEEKEDGAMISEMIMWIKALMVVIVCLNVLSYYCVAVSYSYWKKWPSTS